EAGLSAVSPQSAWLEIEWHRSELWDVGGQRVGWRARRHARGRSSAWPAADETGTVLEEIGNRNRSRDRHEIVRGFSAFLGRRCTGLRDCDLIESLELRDKSRHWIVEADLALFDQHHERDTRDRLRHRGQSE